MTRGPQWPGWWGPSPCQGLLLLLALIGTTVVHAGYDGKDMSGSLTVAIDHAPCVRLFHSTGDIGCRAPTREGVTAPLYYFPSLASSDATHLAQLPKDVVAVIPSSLLTSTNLDLLSASGKVKGVIALNDSLPLADQPSHTLSPDVHVPLGQGTPNEALTIGPDYNSGPGWNVYGNGLAYRSYDLPIVLVTGESTKKVLSWARSNGKLDPTNVPTYIAAMDFYFGPGTATSVKCLGWLDVDGNRSPQCRPLGGQSVWGVIGGHTALKTKPLVMATAGMDGLSLFHDQVPAANDVVSVIATTLGAANALSSAGIDFTPLPKAIGFSLFQGEEWGFIGSRRFTTDLKSFTCHNDVDAADSPDGSKMCLNPVYPSLAFSSIDPTNLEILALDQLGLAPSAGSTTLKLSAIVQSATTSATMLTDLDTAANTLLPDLNVIHAVSPTALPPTPLTSFLKEWPTLNTAILAGYTTQPADPLVFNDPRYHSHYDTKSYLDTSSVTTAATLVARTLFLRAGGNPTDLPSITANKTLVKELCTCLTEDLECPLLKPFIQGETALVEATVGHEVYISPVPSPPSYYTNVMSLYQSQPVVLKKKGQATTAHGVYTPHDYDPANDKVYLSPKPLEMALRGYLSYTLSTADTTSYQHGACSKTAHCTTSRCGGTAPLQTICLHGSCVCPNLAFYHTALDPGLEPEETMEHFKVVDPTAPLWTEPNWGTIGVVVYPDATTQIERVAISTGATMLAASVALAFGTRKSLFRLGFLH